MEAIAVALVATIPPIIAVIASFVLAARWGYGPLAKEANEQKGVLVSTLKTRVEALEAENARLRADNVALKERVKYLEDEMGRLERYIMQRVLADKEEQTYE